MKLQSLGSIQTIFKDFSGEKEKSDGSLIINLSNCIIRQRIKEPNSYMRYLYEQILISYKLKSHTPFTNKIILTWPKLVESQSLSQLYTLNNFFPSSSNIFAKASESCHKMYTFNKV